jgi:hypothetical protein
MEEAIEDTSCYQKYRLERIKCSFIDPLYNQLQLRARALFESYSRARCPLTTLQSPELGRWSVKFEPPACRSSPQKLT